MTPWLNALSWFHYLNFKQKELYHAARFEKDTRYHVIQLRKDLLGDWIISATNGRIKSRLGQTRIIAFIDFAQAFNHFCIMTKERTQRGYHLITYQSDDILLQQILFLDTVNNRGQSLIQSNCAVTPVRRARASVMPAKTTQSQFQEIQQMSFVF